MMLWVNELFSPGKVESKVLEDQATKVGGKYLGDISKAMSKANAISVQTSII